MRIMDGNQTLNRELIDSIASWYESCRVAEWNTLSRLIPAIEQGSREQNTKNQNFSNQFNLFEFFHPGETTHSRILAFFLNPRAAHGQGSLFLHVFLHQIGISQPKKGRWTVTAEVGRVDVLLKRAHPHSVVIIENKSNYAQDQSNQLYRYWYQEIYRKQTEWNLSLAERDKPSADKYQILYLAPSASKQPDESSLCRPTEWQNLAHLSDLPFRVPLQPKHLVFGDFVVKWLNETLNQLPVANQRLREFTQQYVEYWQKK